MKGIELICTLVADRPKEMVINLSKDFTVATPDGVENFSYKVEFRPLTIENTRIILHYTFDLNLPNSKKGKSVLEKMKEDFYQQLSVLKAKIEATAFQSQFITN